MIRSFKYRIFPTRAQTKRLNHTLALCAELYNAGLQERRDAHRINGRTIRYLEQQNQLPGIKLLREDLSAVHSKVLQDALRRLDRAFQAFWRRIKNGERPGYPRFRSARRYDSFTNSQPGKHLFKNGRVNLSKIGDVRIRLHRPVEGQVRTLTVKRSGTGKWYVIFAVQAVPQVLPASSLAVGVDVGLSHLATLSTGEKIPIARFFRVAEKGLARSQRKKKGKAIRRIHERVRFQRSNFAHQISRSLVNNFGTIVFENHAIRQSVAPAVVLWSKRI